MADGGTSVADWISSVFTAGAVGVSLWTTWLTSRQRRQDVENAARLREDEEKSRRQGIVHQISFKLSTLASEALNTRRDLNPHNKTPENLAKETDPFDIVAQLSPKVGYDDSIARWLTTDEENLLMTLKQNDFLTDFCECLARNESIRRGILEYKSRRDVALTMLPPPQLVNGHIASYFQTMEERLRLAPHIIPLGSIVVSIRHLAEINIEMLTRLCNEYRPMMSKHFPDINIHSIGMDSTR